MEQNTEIYELKEPKNPLDPIVIFDPEYKNSGIIVQYLPTKDNPDTNPNILPQKSDKLKEDSIKIPLIKLNNIILNKQQIKSFKLSIIDFLPELILEINDQSGTIQSSDIPGINNIVTIILTAPVDGANKKISLDFYIKSCVYNNGVGTYNCEFKRLDLSKKICKQIGSEELTTYEMLKEIAKSCKLGFAATAGCEDIEDKKWRQIYSETYPNFIKSQLEFAGNDEYSIFDSWIDEFGYLVMVNLSKIFNDDVDVNQLSTKIITGITNSEYSLPENDVKEVQRCITNNYKMGPNNLLFNVYRQDINNTNAKNYGTLNTHYYLTGFADFNKINTKQTELIENSIDGISGLEEYQYETTTFIGIDTSENENQLMQQSIIQLFKLKYFKDLLIVEMPIANYSLQRGMLINVNIVEFNSKNIRTIIDNADNVTVEKASNNDSFTTTNENIDPYELTNTNISITNPSLSGLYYINGIEFYWDSTKENIKQVMYLVKKGIKNKLLNRYTLPKIREYNE